MILGTYVRKQHRFNVDFRQYIITFIWSIMVTAFGGCIHNLAAKYSTSLWLIFHTLCMSTWCTLSILSTNIFAMKCLLVKLLMLLNHNSDDIVTYYYSHMTSFCLSCEQQILHRAYSLFSPSLTFQPSVLQPVSECTSNLKRTLL